MEKVYLAWLWKLSGSPAAHLINSSALPDKIFHPRHQPIIPYLHLNIYFCMIILSTQLKGYKIIHRTSHMLFYLHDLHHFKFSRHFPCTRMKSLTARRSWQPLH